MSSAKNTLAIDAASANVKNKVENDRMNSHDAVANFCFFLLSHPDVSTHSHAHKSPNSKQQTNHKRNENQNNLNKFCKLRPAGESDVAHVKIVTT